MRKSKSVICPECRTENPSDLDVCRKCHAELAFTKDLPIHTRTIEDHSGIKTDDVEVEEIIGGRYRPIAKLGSGGMGEVFKAEQIEPVKRTVALKIIKLGMDTREVVARFEIEEQVLAVMKHPNVAKVFDAGATQSGRPYFVMEFVPGISITEYCNRHKLSTKERLELFIPVCDAVQHAHQKGIIHRDLKPSNVLVEIQGETPVPKIIDFGIAKATQHRLAERTIFTEQGQLIGTPEYMSPEQAEMSGLDVDTRTDIYSLGVMLYELLIGVLPFDREALRSAGFGEIQRIIREEDPARASTRLSGLHDTKTEIVAQRGTDIATLQKQLRGDLDWITLKAMEKDRTRRYSTASDLAADIARHLKEEPIIARPPSNIYNLGKFIRRHKIGFMAAALVTVAIVLGGVAATIGFIRATKAERLATQEAERANREAETSKQVSDFLVDLFEVSEPGQARGAELTALEILERGADRVSEELADQPLTQARLKATIGRVYEKMGLYDEAEPFIKEGLKTRREQLGEKHLDTAQSLGALGDLYRKKGKYAEAEPLLKRAVEIRKELLGPDHPGVAQSLNNLAVLYENSSRYAEAEPLYHQAIVILEKKLGTEHIDMAMSLANLAILKAKQGKYAESEPLFKRVLTIEERELGQDHPRVALAYNNLAIAFKLQGKYEDAEPMYRRALEIQEKVLGSKHPALSRSLNNLANLFLEQDRYQEAEPLYRRSLEISEKALGEEHPQVGLVLDNLAQLTAKLGKYAEAERTYLRALKIRERALGPEHHEVGINLLNLANFYRDQRLYVKAEPLYRRSLSIFRKVLDRDHPDLQRLLEDFSILLRSTGRDTEANALESEIGKREQE